MSSLQEIVYKWVENGDSTRLGQHFCNNYISKPWPSLYYAEDHDAARDIIARWLADNQYENELPPLTKGVTVTPQ